MISSQRHHAARLAGKAQASGDVVGTGSAGAGDGADLQLGRRFHEAGDIEAASQIYRRLLASHPDNADALHLLGVARHQAGENKAAVELIDRAIAVNGGNPNFHSNLATALMALGDFEAAADACRRALALDPGMAAAHCNLGSALMGMGRPEDAAAAHRRAIALKPRFAEAHSNLGDTLLALERPWEAVAAHRQALEINPGLATAQSNLGAALMELGHYDEADAAFRRAIELVPTLVAAFAKRAHLYERTHRLAEASSMAAQGLAVAPNHPDCSLVAARCERRQGDYERGIARLGKVLHLRLAPYDRQRIEFELGQLHDRNNDSAKAFAHFADGNRLAFEAGGDLDKDSYVHEIGALGARFDDDWVRSWTVAPALDGADAPVFLVGFPRSGTTLLDQILDSHPRLQTLDELPVVDELERRIADLPGGYPEALATLAPAQIETLRAAYFASVDRAIDRRPGHILVDKLPLNIIHAGLISRVFPGARFILAVRHPCDVCLSCFMQEFRINEAMAHFFTLEDAASLYAKVMGLWRRYVAVLPLRCHVVRYEDLVDDFAAETRRLLEFLGVGWDDAVLGYADHARNRGKISTPSYHQVAEPIYRRARYRWRRYAEHLAPVIDRLEPYIDYFGYAE